MERVGFSRASPLLLLFYHMEKTGGTTVMSWLEANVRPPGHLTRRLDAVVKYNDDGPGFMCSHFQALVSPPQHSNPELPSLHTWN